MKTAQDKLILGGHEFTSRFILGSGKFSLELVKACIEKADAQIITLALRRANEGGLANILDYIPENVTLLPNTSGARTADEAVRIARLSREVGCGDFVKIEVVHDSKYLLPDNYETIKATEILAKEGFVVMPYMYPDLNVARALVDAGAACVMPLGAPIGSNKGLSTKEFIQILIDEIEIPVIVDAGIGRPSQACEAMEMGADAVMANTAIATAGDVPMMAEAFKKAIEAGRNAYLSGLGRISSGLGGSRMEHTNTMEDTHTQESTQTREDRHTHEMHINESILSKEILEDQKKNRIDHMTYLPGMEDIGSEILDQVVEKMNAYDYDQYTAADVKRALAHSQRTPEDFQALLSPAALPYLEEIAQAAQVETRKHFGNSVYMFTPIYIANYCENYCIYCGFNCHNKINRARLNAEEIEKEMQAIAATGLQEILILTGESRSKSDVEYIGEACKIARKYFKVIGLEIYPVNSDEYAYLHECGADYVTVFQETYNSDKYETLHLAGHKRIYPYRVNAQERALMGGMRGVGFGALLGLDDFRKDAFATGYHAYLLQRKYPHAEIAFSCPRLRPIINNDRINPMDVHEQQLLQVVCAYRLFMPFASITVSTRECERVRDHLVQIAATKISAGVSTGIGGHVEEIEEKGDDQFEISDGRSVKEVYDALLTNHLQPVMSDYIYV